MSDDDPLLLPFRQGIRKLGIGPTKAYELVNAGILETVTIGNRRFVTPESLRRIAEHGDRAA